MCRMIQKLHMYLPVLVLTLCVLLCVAPSARAEEGSCGGNLTWELSAGTLTITGSGDMTDFTESELAPWYKLREQIIRVSLPDGLTSIGQLAFYDCDNLSTVTLPDTVTRVGNYAFMNCTNLQIVRLGSGVKTIEEAAFSDCYSLASLSLPTTLTNIGAKAFYRCESITIVTIPASVKKLGALAFAYCKNLVKATVKASVSLPDWLFYQCDKLDCVILSGTVPTVSEDAFRNCFSLSTVDYSGSGGISAAQLSAVVNSKFTGADGTVEVTASEPEKETVTGSSLVLDTAGNLVQESTTVAAGQNAIVSTTTTTTFDNATQSVTVSNAQVGVNVESENGWEEAAALTKSALESLGEAEVEMKLYLNQTDGVDQSFLDAVTGQNVKTTVLAEDGSTWKLDFAAMETTNGACDLRYSISNGSSELSEELETDRSFVLAFAAAAEINAEVLIQLGRDLAWQNATLFQRIDGALERIQTVVVDTDGCAHFYLASVSDQTEYYIAMNLEDEAAILPDELLTAQNGIRYEPIQYEITGRTSSWNMNIWQVTGIMLAVIVACVVAVGGTMYVLNRRKLQMGYVPPEDE